jgi:hypothetical protein
VIDDGTLAEHRLTDGVVVDDETVETKAAIEEARRRDVELPEDQ